MLGFKLGLLISFFFDVGIYLLLLFLLLCFSLLNYKNGITVCLNYLFVHLLLELSFLLILQFFFPLELFHLLNHYLSLSFLFFLLSKSIYLSCFNLFNYNFLPPQSFFFFPFLNLLNFSNFFESFYFHELIFLFLLNFVDFPIFFLLLKLFLSNGCSFGVGDHLVHELNIIKLLVGSQLSSILNACFKLFFLFLKLIER